MTTRETTNAGVLGDMQRLLGMLEANSTDLPHLEVPRTKLRTRVARALEINQQQAAFTASKQEASKELKTIIVEGQRLANALRAMVKEHYGIRSEKLAEFGLQPFRGRKVKAKAPQGPTPETPGTPSPTPQPPTPTPHPTTTG
ncbi:MAG: hypothetical protein JF614_29525 [Acidobacteria bacterium]|nr:hypothetical protein [Acidobacteriota bacterium]